MLSPTSSNIMSQTAAFTIITPTFEEKDACERQARRERRLAARKYMRYGDSFKVWSKMTPAERMVRFWQSFDDMELDSCRDLVAFENWMRASYPAAITDVLDLSMRIFVVFKVLKHGQSNITFDCLETFLRCFDRARQEIGFAPMLADSQGIVYVVNDPTNPVDRHIMDNPEQYRVGDSDEFMVPEKLFEELLVTPTYDKYYKKIDELEELFGVSVTLEAEAAAFTFCNSICNPEFRLY